MLSLNGAILKQIKQILRVLYLIYPWGILFLIYPLGNFSMAPFIDTFKVPL